MAEEQYDDEEYTMDKHVHYSPFRGGNASEYIVPGGKIDITSHGMGSGIYGLSQQYIDNHPPQTTYGSVMYTFKIDLPYVISNDDECDRYVNSSKEIMRQLDSLTKRWGGQEENIREIASIFVTKMHNPLDEEKDYDFNVEEVTKSLLRFWKDYHEREDFVEMPINYILKDIGNDGVMSVYGVSCHSWHKGDVKFMPYPTYEIGDSLPVAYILSRNGIEKPLTDLTRPKYNYRQCPIMWIKQPIGIKECRYCKSTKHKPLACPDRKHYQNTYKKPI
jgi:hypothetical protein